MTKEDLTFIYDKVVHWIDNTHTKANVFLVIQLAFVGYVITLKDDLFLVTNCLQLLIVFLWTLSLSISLFFTLKTIWPRLANGQASSHIYFEHIHRMYGGNINKGIQAYNKISEKIFKEDLVAQIIVISGIAIGKYKDLQIAFACFVIQLVAFALMFLA